MTMAVNGALFAAFILFIALCHQTSWAASVDPARLPPHMLAKYPSRLRLYYVGIGLTALALLTMLTHLVARGVFEVGAWFSLYGAIAAAILIATALALHLFNWR